MLCVSDLRRVRSGNAVYRTLIGRPWSNSPFNQDLLLFFSGKSGLSFTWCKRSVRSHMVGGASTVLVWMSSGPHKEVHACINSEPEADHYSDHCPRPKGNAKGNRHCENEDVKKSRNETCFS